MPGKHGSARTKPQDSRAAAVRDKCLELRKMGLNYRQIGEEVGIPRQSAHRHVVKALTDIRERTHENAEQVRTMELQRLDDIIVRLSPQVRQGHLGSIDRIFKAMDRRARYLGLDAPARVEASGPGGSPLVSSGNARADAEEIAAALAELGLIGVTTTPGEDDDGA